MPAERRVRISVKETGGGISVQEQAHIFEWFYQGQQYFVGNFDGHTFTSLKEQSK